MALTEADLSRIMAQGYRGAFSRPTPSTPSGIPSIGTIPSIAGTPSVPTATQAWHAPMTIRESSSPVSVLGPVNPLDIQNLKGIPANRHWSTGLFGEDKDKTNASYIGSFTPADFLAHHYEGVTDSAGNKVGFDQFVKDAKAAKEGGGAIFRRNNPQYDVFPKGDADYYSKAPMYTYANKRFDAAQKVNPVASKALQNASGIDMLAFAAPRHVGIFTGGMAPKNAGHDPARLNEKGQLVLTPETRRIVEHEYGHIAQQGGRGDQIAMRAKAKVQAEDAQNEWNAQMRKYNANPHRTEADQKQMLAQKARVGEYMDYVNDWANKNKAMSYPKPYDYNLATGDTAPSKLHYTRPQEMDQLLPEMKREYISTSGLYKHDGPFDAKDSMDAMNWYLKNSTSGDAGSVNEWLKKPENQKAWERLKPMMYQRMQEVVQTDNPAWGAEGAYA